MKLISAKITKSRPNWDGPHLCHLALDRLANYVNEGVLQTVVDQVNVVDFSGCIHIIDLVEVADDYSYGLEDFFVGLCRMSGH